MEHILTQRRILVVDDEEKVALGLRDGLEMLPNCEVAVANDSEQALELFQQQSFDLLITDYNMPGANGITLATCIRQSYSQTAIIMVTACASDALRKQATQASIQHILQKPVHIAKIRNVASKVLAQNS
ncbi:MAG: response regulator [Chloroflexi bacterium]|nr:response regulator [Chloroflexota bacterium]